MVAEVLSALETRRSARKLTEPGPTQEQLERILRVGVNAPDHGRLRPWRFVVVTAQARLGLGDLLARLLKEKIPGATAEQLAAERNKVLRAPCIIAVAARLSGTKIPEIEQILSAGAAAENIFLAARALGFGVMWKTGDAAYNPQMKRYLGLVPEDHIVAFLYIGTVAEAGVSAAVSLDGLVTWL